MNRSRTLSARYRPTTTALEKWLASSWENFYTAKARWCFFALSEVRQARVSGRRAASKQSKDFHIQVILDDRYSGSTIGEAQSTALAMLDKLKEADGIFCSNEPTTFGILLALRQNNLAGSKKFVGFDTSPALVEGLKRGEIQALTAQNPTKMGREAVHALVAKMKGETVHAVIDSGATVVTKENLGTPEIQALLFQSKDMQWSWVSTTVALKELDSYSNL